jgi:hypothetical protein
VSGEGEPAAGDDGAAGEGEAPRREKPPIEQGVDQAVEELGRLATGVVGHLLGAKAVGKAEGEVPSVSPVVDEAIDRVGDTLGKILHAVGEGISELPAPDKAVKVAGATLRDPAPVPKAPGWSGLASGLGHLARGLGTAAGKVADELAGKKAAPPPAAPTPAPAEVVVVEATAVEPAESAEPPELADEL